MVYIFVIYVFGLITVCGIFSPLLFEKFLQQNHIAAVSIRDVINMINAGSSLIEELQYTLVFSFQVELSNILLTYCMFFKLNFDQDRVRYPIFEAGTLTLNSVYLINELNPKGFF